MKLFKVKQGTKGILLTRDYESDDPYATKDWSASKELTFPMEQLVIDPITLRTRTMLAAQLVDLAKKGYAVYTDSAFSTGPGSTYPKYMFAVKLELVEVQ